jgi:predicted nucleic acid-binding protein
VIDASALVELLVRGPRAGAVEIAIAEQQLFAPEAIYIETLATLRSQVRRTVLAVDRAALAVARLRAAPVQTLPIRPLIGEIWRRRDNLSAPDAAYVAVTRLLGCPLVTADTRLERAPNLGITVILV